MKNLTAKQKNFRGNLLTTLWHFSSMEQCRHYKRSVPFVNIPEELIEQWSGNYLIKQDWFKEAFNEEELEELVLFNESLESFSNQFSGSIPDVPEIESNEHWLKLQESAQESLRKFEEE